MYMIQAANVRELESRPRGEPPFAVWQKHFDDPELRYVNGYASVVDEDVFTDLRSVSARGAEKLKAAGVVVGRVKL